MRRLLALAVVLLMTGLQPGLVRAAEADPRLVARLDEDQRRAYKAWLDARSEFDSRNDAYWAAVNARRADRRRKVAAGLAPTPADFIMQHPPKYAGPPLRPDIAKIQAELSPPPEPSEIATLPEMLEAARQHYRFQPTLVPEREFKRRYAQEALAVGLTKEEVTRIYAFETGGRGTFDMQAGINPETRQGRVISTAMGYAQLLAANSIGELVRYGDGFVSRLGMLAARRDTPPEQARALAHKIDAIRAMMRVGRSVPREWSRHVAMARVPQGYAIHTLNLDGDVGPWLQVIKLKGIKDTAEQAGRPGLSPAELELMNLAGPRTGLEMMEPVGRTAPTANFFSRQAYYRNTIVREKTAAELLAAIDYRMGENMQRPGSIEFATVFDELMGRPRQARTEDSRQVVPDAAALRARRPAPGPAPVLAPAPANARPQPPWPVPPLPVRAQPPRAAAPQLAVPPTLAAKSGPAPTAMAAAAISAAALPAPPQPTPERPAEQPLVEPMPPLAVPTPVRAVRPARLQWAPPGLGAASAPLGFPD